MKPEEFEAEFHVKKRDIYSPEIDYWLYEHLTDNDNGIVRKKFKIHVKVMEEK